ncbi:hypothetical protein PGT21_024459 [Puccinia graminis f. sp. tritici]|uniref:Chromo domain-containing protein n=1 Tax=Puccinia graminis f. sp. tritici TaxID=56615 RepID=A0A5B0M049_PUCGR|nr:hypothetical protein PGT21_024459 [Puccinia graminis f. sp. tritici]
MAPFPQKVGGYPSIPKDTRGRKGRWPAGRVSFQPVRYLYLVDWKDTLPVDEVQVPRRLEGSPSGRRGTSTSSTGRTPFRLTRYKYLVDWKDTLLVDEVQVPTGRTPFRSTRYKYLVDWKDTLPVNEVQVPRRLEGSPSSRPFRGRVSEDTRSDTRCGRRIPASGCGWGFGCSDGRKKQPDIRIRAYIRMPIDHLYCQPQKPHKGKPGLLPVHSSGHHRFGCMD